MMNKQTAKRYITPIWRKILIILISGFSVFSIAYAYKITQKSLKAASAPYVSGGNITGRINQSPVNLSVKNASFKKGDRILLGTKNPETNNSIAIQLIDKSTYTSYNCPTHTANCSQSAPITAWEASTTEALGHPRTGIEKSDFIQDTSIYSYVPFTSTDIYQALNNFNASIINADKRILTYKNATLELASISASSNPTQQKSALDAFSGIYNKKGFSLYSIVWIDYFSNYYNDRKFSENYWTSTFYSDNTGFRSFVNYYIVGSTGKVTPYGNGTDINSALDSDGREYALNAVTSVDLSEAVFALSTGNGSGIAAVSIPVLPSGYASLYADAVGEPMKVRLKNSALTASTKLLQIENSSQNPISKITENSTVYLKAEAQAGNDGNGAIYTVSALVFDANGNFLYYRPLESAKGSGRYAFDMTGIPVGNYKIGIVNEAYDVTNTAPADSSAITDVLSLEVVEPLSDLTFIPQTDLMVNKNVNDGDKVGMISTKNGVGNPTYRIAEDSAYPNEYKAIKLGSDGKTVIVDTDPLHSKTYHFKIQAQDANGDPVVPLEISASFTVTKNNLTVAFDDLNQTKISITQAASGWNETATATPAAGTKITYAKAGGSVGLINIDSDTGAITYAGGGGYGKVTIKATADDDPNSGYDDFNPADTTKEVVIYREVDGNVTPHTNSSSTTVPNFKTSDVNIKPNGIIGTVLGTHGTPDNGTSGSITYLYGMKNTGDYNYFSVNPNTGEIKTTADLSTTTGAYHITVTVSDNWSTKEIQVTINVGVANAEDLKFYENSTSNTVITTKNVKVTDTNVTAFATVKGSTNTNPVTYKIQDGSINIIEINPNSGAITIHGVGTVIIVAEKQGAAGQANAVAELTFTVTPGEQEFIYTDATLSNELPKDQDSYRAYSEVYAPNKTFQLYTTGNPPGSTVTYQLKAGSPTDVISVDASGLVTILNASLNNQMGKVIVEAISHDPSGNYADKTIELPINIEKGTRVISFKEKPIYVTNGKGKVTPVIEVDGVVDTSGDILIEVDSNEDHTIAWTNDNKTIDYNYSGDTGKDIKVHATKPMDRNYKAAEADGTIHIMGPDENVLAITSPGQIIYGDRFTIRSSQYDADSTNVQYTFEVDKTTYISNPTVNGNSAEFDAKQFSGSNKTTITVTRTADGETPLSKQVQVTVLPKPIEIIIDNKEKLKGEQNPPLTYQDFRNDLVSWNGVQDVIQESDIKLNTTAKTDSNAGAYPIKGDAKSLNKTYPNYSFSFKEGTLTIIEENIEDDWYHLELDDGNNTVYTGEWTNQDVNIISDHIEYINLSLNQSTWNANQVTVTKEGENNQSFWMKKDSGAITKEKQELIRIDKTAPRVKGIKAKDTNNKLQDIINQLSGGIFFKPGTSFEVTTTDEKDDLKVSGTKEISYKVYKTEKQSRADDELIKDGALTVTNEKAKITISETTGNYRVCVTPTDNAGNTNTESCHEVALKKIDVDVDGDGKPDFNDPDGDGCPDLNIKWKDPNNPDKWIVINGDRDYDGIPDLNIDSDGDGKPDLNVNTDNDGKPDLNLVILKKSDWKPTKCVKVDTDNGILEEYCTGTSVKPKINVDTDGDNIPNINVDNNGDMKADVNIDTDNDLKADINIADIHKWEPIHEYKSGITYDSIGVEQEEYKPKLNIDTDGDGRPDLNIDLDGDGQPDINIDLDGDLIPDIDIDSNGDGKPDVNVDIDGNGTPDENIKEITEWKPNKNVDGDIPYDTMSFDETEEPTVPDEPDTSVKGQYNPVTSIGGAVTGDSTQAPFLTASLLLSTSILLLFILKKENHY